MPNFPVRNLGGAGVISDVFPCDLPPNVFSAGVNVRFDNGGVSRGPVMREVNDLTAYDAAYLPSYIFSIPPVASASEVLVTANDTFSKVLSITGGTIANITPSGITGSASILPYSHTALGGVAYINRKSHIPYKKASGDSLFVALPDWNTNWRCHVLRAYKDFLVAFNVSKSGTEYPSMVKWSDIATYGSAPASWDHTSTTNSAGENILNQMRGAILDACVLRDTMIIYGENEVWAMSYTGSSFIFDFRKRFDDVGIINTNCVVEVDGSHFVFDRNDIIIHDGSSKKSIIHGKNKDFVFGGLVRELSHLCFVTHNPKLSEIQFCYPSQDALTGFPNPLTGCNRSAVYNYRNDTWSFSDLPNVTASTYGIVNTGNTWTSAGSTSWNSMGGTFASDGDDTERHQLFTSYKSTAQGITKSRVLGSDLLTNSRLAKPVIDELLKPAFVERIFIDLDESGVSLRSYKSMLRIYPQIVLRGGTGTVQFQFGASNVLGEAPDWDTAQTYDTVAGYQIPVRKAGRYLSHRMTHTGASDFIYSGFDAELTVRGKR